MQKRVPGPEGRPFLGVVSDFADDPLQKMLDMVVEYGDIVTFKMFGQSFYIITNPDYIREVLVTKVNHFPKAERDVLLLRRFVGHGLLTSGGAYHRQQRKLIQPAFHTTRIQTYADIMVQSTADLVSDWRPDEVRDLSQEMMKLTMFIVSKTLFDVDKDEMAQQAETIGAAIHEMQAITDADFNLPFILPDWVPTPRNRRRLKAQAVLTEAIDKIVAQRRATAVDGQIEDTGDLLSMLLLAQDEDGDGMSDTQVRDEAITLFVAGHETTSNALTWTWYLLSRHPQVAARLHDEVDTVLNGRLPTLDDLSQLPYTLMVIKEAMRLYPPAWVLNGRQANQDTTIGEYSIPAGSVVFISPYVMHRQPHFFPNPERFDPERFTEEREKALPRYAYMPFGGGPRICIGNAFAMMEAHLIVATIAQQFELELLLGQEIVPNPQITLSSKDGLKMRLRRREAGAERFSSTRRESLAAVPRR